MQATRLSVNLFTLLTIFRNKQGGVSLFVLLLFRALSPDVCVGGGSFYDFLGKD